MNNNKKLLVYYPPKKKKIDVSLSDINSIKAYFEEENIIEKLYPESIPEHMWHVPFVYSSSENILSPLFLNDEYTLYRVCKQQKGKQKCGFVKNKYIPCVRDCNYEMIIQNVYNGLKYKVAVDEKDILRVIDNTKKNNLREKLKIFNFLWEKGIAGKIADAWVIQTKSNREHNKMQYIYIIPSYTKKLSNVLIDDSTSFSSFLDIIREGFSLIFELHQLGYLLLINTKIDFFAYSEKNKLIFVYPPSRETMENYMEKSSSKKLIKFIATNYLSFIDICNGVLLKELPRDKKEKLRKWFTYAFKYGTIFARAFKKKINENENMNVLEVMEFERKTVGSLLSSLKEDMFRIYENYEKPILYNDQPYFLKQEDRVFEDMESCLLPKEKEWNIYYNIEKEDEQKNSSDKKFLSPTYFGSGAFGSVYKGCRKKENENCGIVDGVYIPCGDCEYAVKFTSFTNENSVKNLVEIYQKASDLGLCSPLHDWWICEDTHDLILITDVYEKTLLEVYQDENISILQKCAYLFKIFQMIHSLHQCKIIHGDLHLNNIMIDKNGRPFFIDMDLSIMIKDPVSLDIGMAQIFSDFRAILYAIPESGDSLYFIAISAYFLGILKKDFIKYFQDHQKIEFSFDEVMQKEKEVIDKITRDIPIPPIELIQEEVKKGLLPSLEKYFM